MLQIVSQSTTAELIQVRRNGGILYTTALTDPHLKKTRYESLCGLIVLEEQLSTDPDE